jgi:hypothetical protein
MFLDIGKSHFLIAAFLNGQIAMRLKVYIICLVALIGCKSGVAPPANLASSDNRTSDGFCDITPVRSDALDHPSKHAWDLFATVNHPAKDKKVARGEPDCTKRIGAPGTTSVWETWRNAASEVYLANGAEPPDWQDTSLPDEKPGVVPPRPLDAAGVPIPSFHNLTKVSGRPTVQFSPDGIFDGNGGFGETRLNKSTYEFIRNQCLYSVEGQQRYAKAMGDGKKPPIKFPVESIEVKAAWLDFDREKIPQDKWGTSTRQSLRGRSMDSSRYIF